MSRVARKRPTKASACFITRARSPAVCLALLPLADHRVTMKKLIVDGRRTHRGMGPNDRPRPTHGPRWELATEQHVRIEWDGRAPTLFWSNRDGNANESGEPIGLAEHAGGAGGDGDIPSGERRQGKGGGQEGGGVCDAEREMPRSECDLRTVHRLPGFREGGRANNK